MKDFGEYLDKMGYSWNDFDRTYEMENLIERYADEKVKQALSIDDVVGRSEQLSLSDFKVGFEYEEYQMDSARYLNNGMIWVKKTYGLNSPRLHKIQKLIEEGKVRRS